ncbi:MULTISPECIES: hypothetical protein [Streptomyces]|uniref:Hydrogenase expression protein HypF n=1 Tax=Streptomyces griseocarneus TaxID=51201 RepID=A0ABX7RRW4_9ACTN|nr:MULTISPECIES: hypothetical protein [Streptomyces]QSY51017.1 hypothetical protein J3S04_08975 [Streptomyces griseocarneus]
MPTDHEHDGRPDGPTRSGPRHAAPRKPLLSRLHMPAGKAVALAAMPSAVLMGMGLTPTLAQARPVPPVNPFGDAGCVTAPDAAPEESPGPTDEPTPSGSASPSPSSSASASAKADGKADGKTDGKTDGKDSGATSRGREPSGASSAKPPTASPSPSSSPSPSASPSKKTNPLDPLGLGEKLGDILTGRKGDAKPDGTGASPAPSASPSASPSPSGRQPGAPKVPAAPKASTSKDATEAGAAPEAKGTPKTPSASDSASPSPSPSASGDTDKTPKPCPHPNVIDENEKRAFPNQPWYLEASRLTLTGLTYEGVKKITTVNGQQKSVLKFTADSLAIRDLHQVVNSQGKQYHVAGMGTESTVGGGRITMYTEELKGKLLGLIPATQSPTSPPPLIPGVKLPIPIFFTDVKIRQSGQYGGTLHIPNLHQYLTEGTYP